MGEKQQREDADKDLATMAADGAAGAHGVSIRV